MAKVYLGVNDSWVASNNSEIITGNDTAGSDEVVTIAGGVSGVTLNQSVERMAFSGTNSSYSFQKQGNVIHVYQTVGATKSELASAVVQDDANGTRLTFSNGTINVTYDGTTMKLGDATVTTITDTTPTVSATAIDTTLTSSGAAAGQTFTLTAGIDSIPGLLGSAGSTSTTGNDVINAPAGTFTSLDTVDGGAGIDTINVVFGGDLTTATGATVKNVEIANLTAAAAITAADVTGWTGLTTLNVASSGNIAGVVAATTTDVNISNGIAGVAVNGGHNVTVSNSTLGAVNVGATTAAAGTVTATNSYINGAGVTGTVTIKGAGALTATASKGAIIAINGTSLTATAANAVSLADVTAHTTAAAAASAAYTAATTGNGTDASGLALTAAQAAQTGFTNLAALLAPGGTAAIYSADQTVATSIGLATAAAVTAGSITAAQKVQIDAAFIAALTAPSGSALLARAAALALVTPLQTLNTAAVAAAVTADVVNDANLLAAQTATAAVVTADGVIATNVKEVTVSNTSNTALASATISGNYGTATTGVGAGTAFQNAITDPTGLGTLTNVSLSNAGASELKGQALINVSATGMSANVAVTNTTAAHAQTFTLSGITGGTYADANATTINIVSNGAATNVLTALTSTVATKINVSGAAGLTLGGTFGVAATVVDASASSGSNKITIGAGQQYVGGTGADTVTTNNGALQTATVDGGAGTDTLVLSAAADFATTGAAKFLNFEVIKETGLTVDVSLFTGSTIVAEKIAGATTLSGLNATQAAGITIYGNSTPVISVTGATTPGQLDVVATDVNDGAATKSTITLTTPSLAGVETWNITATDHVTVGSLVNAAALTNLNVTGAGNVSITTGALALNTNSVIDAHAVTGTVLIDASLSSANGLKIIGSATGVNTLTASTAGTKANIIIGGDGGDHIVGGASSADTITAGNGNNLIDGAGGADIITVGNGNNSINAGGSAYAGILTVTAGNGYNVIIGGAGADKITVGTGGNVINGGAGADTITFGTHAAGYTDGVVYTPASTSLIGTDLATAIVANGVVGANTDIVTGLHAGDTITTGLTANVMTLTNVLAGTFGATATTLDTVYIVRGTYTASTGNFSAGAAGTDSYVLITDHTGGAAHSDALVLVGYADVATTSIAAGVITLA